LSKESDSRIYVTFVLGGLNYGGAERVASYLIHFWHQNHHTIKLVTRKGSEHDFFVVPESIPRIVLGGEGESANKLIALLKNIPYILRLRRAIKKSDTPVVLSFLTKTNIHTILACFGLKKKVVISERNDTTKQFFPFPWPSLRRLLYRYADIVTANSDIAIHGMKQYVPEHKMIMIPNPVILADETANPHQSENILTVGRLVPHKAHWLIIEAFSMLPVDFRENWNISIVGEGEEDKVLIKLSEDRGIKDCVNLPGLVSELAPYYTNAGIFILPSEYEGTPNVLLEAMSAGLPCIISDSLTEARKYVTDGQNGFYFKNGNAADLSEKIFLLMNRPDLRKTFGNYSIERIKEFELTAIGEKWIDILSENL